MSEPVDPAHGAEKGTAPDAPPPVSRPAIERLGMAVIALFVATMFGAVAAASWVGGEGFLALMAGTGALMTLWAGVNGLRRG